MIIAIFLIVLCIFFGHKGSHYSSNLQIFQDETNVYCHNNLCFEYTIVVSLMPFYKGKPGHLPGFPLVCKFVRCDLEVVVHTEGTVVTKVNTESGRAAATALRTEGIEANVS